MSVRASVRACGACRLRLCLLRLKLFHSLSVRVRIAWRRWARFWRGCEFWHECCTLHACRSCFALVSGLAEAGRCGGVQEWRWAWFYDRKKEKEAEEAGGKYESFTQFALRCGARVCVPEFAHVHILPWFRASFGRAFARSASRLRTSLVARSRNAYASSACSSQLCSPESAYASIRRRVRALVHTASRRERA
eukprot:800133-Pleurochrysis_carterae.AAC.1